MQRRGAVYTQFVYYNNDYNNEYKFNKDAVSMGQFRDTQKCKSCIIRICIVLYPPWRIQYNTNRMHIQCNDTKETKHPFGTDVWV